MTQRRAIRTTKTQRRFRCSRAKWRKERRQAQASDICGGARLRAHRHGGCGRRIQQMERQCFRCTWCKIPFHRTCAEKHFGNYRSAPRPVLNEIVNLLTNHFNRPNVHLFVDRSRRRR